jgi:dihydroxyacetone kinase
VTPRLEIVVDELVVRGLSPAAARVTAAALEARLNALAREAQDALPERAESVRRLDPVTVPTREPAAVGDAVAGAVWSAVSGGGRR